MAFDKNEYNRRMWRSSKEFRAKNRERVLRRRAKLKEAGLTVNCTWPVRRAKP